MPCWYYDRQDLKNTPSFRDGIDADVEARYRREGAKFIIDVGTKLGLRYDSCATGVVYFHRFYMFHSFREFNRFVMGACCLFLAAKVEETPKKCKDIVRMAKNNLTDKQFAVFGSDPKEEVMTLERVLLQTIKFDLQVEHPYAFLLKYAKYLKGDKEKVQKMVQMGWTFVNDSMCTMLCLEWEPEIISVALIYLACRLTKFEITDWQGKQPGFRGKWWDAFVEDVSLEMLEDICHLVLDLYSNVPQNHEDSPPPSKPQLQPQQRASAKRQRQTTPQEQVIGGHHPKVAKMEANLPTSKSSTPASVMEEQNHHMPVLPPNMHPSQPPASQETVPTTGYSHYNPYMTSQMYTSSFMSQKGAESIQSLIGGGGAQGAVPSAPGVARNYPQQPGYTQGGATGHHYPPQQAPPSGYPAQQQYPSQYSQPPPQQPGQQQHQGYPQGYPPTNVPPPGYTQPPPQQQAQGQAAPNTYQRPPYPPQHQGGYPPNKQYPPQQNHPPSQGQFAGSQGHDPYPPRGQGSQPPPQHGNYQNYGQQPGYIRPHKGQPSTQAGSGGLPVVRITGRR